MSPNTKTFDIINIFGILKIISIYSKLVVAVHLKIFFKREITKKQNLP